MSSRPSNSQSFASIFSREAPNLSMPQTSKPSSTSTPHTAPPAYSPSETSSIKSSSTTKTLVGKIFHRKSSDESTHRDKKAAVDEKVARDEAKHAARAHYFATL
ncbi:hypothetical protein HBI56_043150 [Parastagonospora nodorum]|nr:hypothetical protein HBH53_009900 [Parastagonospora nodorum]KAH3986184.1 hypothetical protein HBH52_041090 [Parastagonospora nodorum]KAH3988072.1 hypothetical protein HBH51_007920 [Parastagonospora nodorum]KAH4004569.1 hypothetical protein HBI10_046450 [Parastagonospora nodorum]KAH4031183.1 hypothetical protein HBI13_029900 [Parastagonospora nodorum]